MKYISGNDGWILPKLEKYKNQNFNPFPYYPWEAFGESGNQMQICLKTSYPTMIEHLTDRKESYHLR